MVGAQVMGMFLDGADSQLPVIFGSIPKIELPSQEQVIEITKNLSSEISVAPYTGRNINDAYIQNISFNVGSSDLAKSWKFFRDSGWTSTATAAMLGNFMVECGGTTDLIVDKEVNDNGEPAKGIAMWRTTRNRALDIFAQGENSTWNVLETQLKFVNYEFATEANYYDPKDFNSVTDLGHSVVFFQHKYERPAYVGGWTKAQLNSSFLDLNLNLGEKRYSEYTIYGKRVFERLKEKERIDFAQEIYTNFTEKEYENLAKEIIESQT